MYSFLIAFAGDGTGFKVPYSHVVWFMEAFFIPFFILFTFKDLLKNKSWEFVIVVVGLIAALITLYLMLNPIVNIFIRDTIIRDSLSSISDTDILYRGFTIAESSTFSYGIIQGLILSICLFSVKKSYLYAIPILFIFLSILVNARVGFISVIISILLLILKREIKIKTLISLGAAIYVGYLFLFESSFAENNLESLKWGFSSFDDAFMFLKGKDRVDSNFDVLTGNMIHFPNGFLNIIFGEGRIVFGTNDGSDIGYINQIYLGGIVYLLLILAFLFYMFARSMKYSQNSIFSILFFVTLLIVNFKGDALFVSNGFFRLITFYYTYLLLTRNTNSFTSSKQSHSLVFR